MEKVKNKIWNLAKDVRQKYKAAFRDRSFKLSLIQTFGLLFFALVVNFLAGNYATKIASSPVGDLILSNVPVFNVDEVFVYGPLIMWAIISLYCLHDPKRIPFWLKSVALFVIIRSAFITLTHVGPFPDVISVEDFSLSSKINLFIFSSGADLFFSGHTGLPFMFGLIFWKNIKMRIFCFISSVFFGIVVLLGHLHYSIDVLSAFFITYTIYHISTRFFPADFKRFHA
jgi:hypothetical protein